MDAVWRLGTASVRDVADAIADKSELAYTTVMTIMSRLTEKRLLERRMSGRAYVYRPRLSREDYAEKLARSRVRGLISDFGAVAVAQFAEELRTDPERAKMLDELLRRGKRR